VILIASANNTPGASYPATYASVFWVASHHIEDPYLFYYNPKPPVEFGAFGIDVRVAWSNGGWQTATGNSFATPHIAGVIAKILSKHTDPTIFQMKAVLSALPPTYHAEPVEVEGDGDAKHEETL
jgi:subtilisin family serine protease